MEYFTEFHETVYGLPWASMEAVLEIPWNSIEAAKSVMEIHGSRPWNSMKSFMAAVHESFHGRPRHLPMKPKYLRLTKSVGILEQSLTFVNVHETLSWNIMDFHGIQWNSMHFYMQAMEYHGTMEVHGMFHERP